MRKNPVLFNKTLVIAIFVIFIGMSINPSTGTIVEKTSSPNYRSSGYIQNLIDNASDGDTINIPNGIYYENIVIDKSINLIGENKDTTIIDGGLDGDVVTISADWVNITGFTITNGFSPPFFGAGILINSHYNTVSGNNLIDNYYCGVGVSSSSGSNTVSDNTISDNGDGIIIWGSSGNTITGNSISDNKYGIYLSSTNYNIITGNTVHSTSGDGISIHGSDYNIITGNIISSNTWKGIKIDASSNDNIIYHNNLIQNNQNADDESNNIWINSTLLQGNYWSDYYGSDNNNDGIGDTPYDIPSGDNQDEYPLMYHFGPPFAKFNYNKATSEFDASKSGDYNGYIVSYEWDFGDGETGNGEKIYHKYCEIGTYNVTLILTDNDGLVEDITKSVEVTFANIPPLIPVISGPNSGKPGVEYEYSFSMVDPDGDDFYLWVEWGDGNSTGWLGPYHSGEPVIVGHSWEEKGTYEIKAKIKDFCSESPWGSLEITIPRDKATNNMLLLRILERFPLLQRLLNI